MARRTTPPLNALRTFEAAARHGSFARAAKELFVTPSAVSQQITALESHLGLSLFDRARRRISLTEAGNSYRASLTTAFDRIESATIDLLSQGNGPELRVGSLPSLANYWLIPRLKRFIEAHPSIQLEVVSLELDFASAERSPQLESRGIDVGVFFGDGRWADLSSEKLMDERLIAVAAPSWVLDDRFEEEDLLQRLPLLRHSTRPQSWSKWFQARGEDSRSPRGPGFEHFHMLVEAAKAGLGIALVPEVYIQSELRLRTLIQVTDVGIVASESYHTVCEADRAEEPAIRLFRAWARSEATNGARRA